MLWIILRPNKICHAIMWFIKHIYHEKCLPWVIEMTIFHNKMLLFKNWSHIRWCPPNKIILKNKIFFLPTYPNFEMAVIGNTQILVWPKTASYEKRGRYTYSAAKQVFVCPALHRLYQNQCWFLWGYKFWLPCWKIVCREVFSELQGACWHDSHVSPRYPLRSTLLPWAFGTRDISPGFISFTISSVIPLWPQNS